MRLPEPNATWPESWTMSYAYDRVEIGDGREWPGYRSAYRVRRKCILDLVAKVAPRGARILDLAAGQGNFSLLLAERGYDVTWNDLRGELEDYVKLKHETGRVRFAPGNVFEIDFAAQFDVVLAAEIIEHVAHPDQFLGCISALVKPGGHLVLTTPNGGYFLNRLPRFTDCRDPAVFESRQFQPNADGHIFLLHQDEMVRLAMAAGLDPVELRLFSNPLTSGHLKSEIFLRFLSCSAVDIFEHLTRMLPSPIRRRFCTSMALLCRRGK